LALRWAIGEANLRNAEVVAVHAIQLFLTATGLPTYPAADVRFPFDVEDSARQLINRELGAVQSEAEGVAVSRMVIDSAPARGLLQQSEGALMLVVGSRGLGGFPGLTMGSVAHQCVQHAGCPVVVVGQASVPARAAEV
jgi:nucleotide-binding universal stress UspA family protein